jgi:hypothetical protein
MIAITATTPPGIPDLVGAGGGTKTEESGRLQAGQTKSAKSGTVCVSRVSAFTQSPKFVHLPSLFATVSPHWILFVNYKFFAAAAGHVPNTRDSEDGRGSV